MKDIIVVNNNHAATAAVNNVPGSAATTVIGNSIREAVEDAMIPAKKMVSADDQHPFDGVLCTSDNVVDYCDNPSQVEVLKHHYNSEFGSANVATAATADKTCSKKAQAVQEVLKDYREDSIIHKVVNDTPITYRGLDGAQKAWEDLCDLLQDNVRLDLQHMNVWHNHAQVDWKAELLSSHKTIYGTDTFTFDEKDNHITSQTTVALSSYSEEKNED